MYKYFFLSYRFWILFLLICFISLYNTFSAPFQDSKTRNAKIIFSIGNITDTSHIQSISFKPGSDGLIISGLSKNGIEKNGLSTLEFLLKVGAGNVESIKLELSWPEPSAKPLKMASHKDAYTVNDDAMWGFLIENGSTGQAARLKDDTWNQPDTPLLTVLLDKSGTKGFTIALKQLVHHKAMWLPEHDVFIKLADDPVDFDQHIASLHGKRTLDRVEEEKDATLQQFQELWKDFGNPYEWDASWQTRYMGTTGHLTITAAAYGSLYKFAVDRWGNVRPDFASPHKFKFDLVWPNCTWKSQKIENGLPILVTNLERQGQQSLITQFAAPIASLETSTSGEIESVMFSKVQISGKSGPVNFSFKISGTSESDQFELIKHNFSWVVINKNSGEAWLTVNPGPGLNLQVINNITDNSLALNCTGKLESGETKEILIKLISPTIPLEGLSEITAMDFSSSLASVHEYWENWLAKGAYFEVPEKEVNRLYRAILWHAFVLPRERMQENGEPVIDLPYANTAYGQENADWPVNQAVYVDYLIYGLRGYWDIANKEFKSMFKTQQQPEGRISGFANWGVYTPSMLYSVAQNYLLSQDRPNFEEVLPQSLQALDWCLAEIEKSLKREGSSGLIQAPLNDLTHAEREWAFTQAYFVAGLETFGVALKHYGHPRAVEVIAVSQKMRLHVEREFSKSSVNSPVVQLADGTWINYVPSDAMTSRRLLDEWYPTDVDVGPLHLARLGAIDPKGWLTTAMLHDHEDNYILITREQPMNRFMYNRQMLIYGVTIPKL